METRVHLPETEKPSSIKHVISALNDQSLEPKHDKKLGGLDQSAASQNRDQHRVDPRDDQLGDDRVCGRRR